MRRVILASSSKNRKTVMDSLNISYEIIPADIDEKAIRDKDFAKRAEKIARAKAEKVLVGNSDAIIIAGDSFGVINKKEFEKPASIEEAEEMLIQESGKGGRFYSGFCYIDLTNNINFSTTFVIDFALREISNKEAQEFVKKYPVTTWSGAFFPGLPYPASFIEEVHGSYNAFTYGIPTELLIQYLKKSGIEVRP